MLFLVELKHDAAHCPGYHHDLLPKWVDGLKRRDEIAAQVGVKLVNWYSALPEHKEFAIVDADSATKIAGLVVQILPSEQSKISVTPIATADEVLAMAAQMGGG